MRNYVLSVYGGTVAAAKTLLWVNPGTSRSVEIVRFWVEQGGSATSEMVRLQVVTQASAFPTMTTTNVSLSAMCRGDGAGQLAVGTGAAGTCGGMASAENGGTKTILFERTFNNLNGVEWLASGYGGIELPASHSQGFGLYIPVAPTGTTGWAAGIELIER